VSKEVAEWLSEYQNPHTKDLMQKRFQKFVTWSGKTAEEISKLSVKQVKHLILQFQTDMVKQRMPNNTIRVSITAVRTFFTYLEKPMTFRRGQLVKPRMASGYHKFSNGDLGRMYNVGNAFDKALLAVGVSLGWEVSAILGIEREDFKSYVRRARKEGEEFFSFESQREKTGAKRFGILNPLALEALETYFAVSKEKTGKLFPMTNQGANKLLARLTREANIALTGKVRWHNLRSWLMSKLSRAKFNEFQIKYLVGKQIPLTDMTYLYTLQQEIEEQYPKAYSEHLSILKYQSRNKEGKIEKLEAEVTRLKLLVKGMTDAYGEKIAEEAIKRLRERGETKTVQRLKAMSLDELLIEVAKSKKRIVAEDNEQS
jgi:site-specific recombinase XerD